MSNKTRLVEIIVHEPVGSGRSVVLRVNGENDAIVIEPGRSVKLVVEGDGLFAWLGRKLTLAAMDLPEDLKALVGADLGDTDAPTSDETAFDPEAASSAILSHIDLMPDAPAPIVNDAEQTILDAIAATQAKLDQVDAELAAAGDQDALVSTLTDALQGTAFHVATPGEVGALLGTAATVGADEDEGDDIVSDDGDLEEITAEELAMAPASPTFSRETLESLTFPELREIGYGLNVKGTSKAELVRDILAAITPKA